LWTIYDDLVALGVCGVDLLLQILQAKILLLLLLFELENYELIQISI